MKLALALLCGLDDDEALRKVLETEARVRSCVERAKPAYVFFGNGSGVCVAPDGWVLTNFHVAGDRDGQRVRMTGGKVFTADVVGWDPHGDISLCKLRDAKDLPFCGLGDSDGLQVGDPVIAVGNPFLLGNGSWEPTITLGIVSALHRYMDNPGYFDAIQTDAQINPGNSGGPLLALDGRVVGINGRIDIKRFMNRVNTGIGYAIPARQIQRYMKAFKEGGRVWEGYIHGLTYGECGRTDYDNVGEYGDGVFVGGSRRDRPPRRRVSSSGTSSSRSRAIAFRTRTGSTGFSPTGRRERLCGSRSAAARGRRRCGCSWAIRRGSARGISGPRRWTLDSRLPATSATWASRWSRSRRADRRRRRACGRGT
jgi:hypothetical protein